MADELPQWYCECVDCCKTIETSEATCCAKCNDGKPRCDECHDRHCDVAGKECEE